MSYRDNEVFRRLKAMKVCYRCGMDATTNDHVPQAALFKDLKVIRSSPHFPCCNTCNNIFTREDEIGAAFLRMTGISSKGESKELHEHAYTIVNGPRSVIQLIRHNYKPAQGNKHLRDIIRKAVKTNLVTPAGVFIEETYSVKHPSTTRAIEILGEKLMKSFWMFRTMELFPPQNISVLHGQVHLQSGEKILEAGSALLQNTTGTWFRPITNESGIIANLNKEEKVAAVLFLYYGHVILSVTPPISSAL